MAHWTVSTIEKKSCEEREIWKKGNKTIVRINGFRWGTFSVETNDDNPPDGITAENEDSIDMYSHCGDNIDTIDLISMDDGWYSDFEFDGFEGDEEQEILDAIDEADDYYEYLEENGWSNDDTEGWLHGSLEITKDA
jgi:hypothetical protein